MPPVFSIDENLIFPHPVLCEPDGLLGVGGNLSVDRLLLAYRWGIYPWYNEDHPVLWWWTVPRLMIDPAEVHISHSLKTVLNRNRFKITFDQDFHSVIHACRATPRQDQDGTWIQPEIIDAYTELHKRKIAHSVEVYHHEKLVGGLYGVAIGNIFCGESMFTTESNASKVAFVHLCRHLVDRGFKWIDCQQDTPHMRAFGARLVEAEDYLSILRENQLAILRSGVGIFF